MALIEWLSALPLLVLGTVMLAFFAGYALLGMRFARRRIVPALGLSYDDAYYGAAMVQSVMLLYGLIAALIAVGVWSRYTAVSDTVSAEATAIASLWRDLGGYPQPTRDEGRDVLRGYTEQIINEAWPQMRQGKIPREGVAWMDVLQQTVFTFEPKTEGQKVLHAETVRSFNQLVQVRRQRLDAVQGGLPGVFWIILFPGAIVCITLCLFFHVPDARYQALLLLGVSGSLAMVLFVIIALDRPFSGQTGISAGSYQLIYDHHMKR